MAAPASSPSASLLLADAFLPSEPESMFIAAVSANGEDGVSDGTDDRRCDGGTTLGGGGRAAGGGAAGEADPGRPDAGVWPPLLRPMMCVYMLSDVGGRRTYVGATVNLMRRVRQHNGDLAGGAVRTHGGTWTPHAAVTGFVEWRDALRFEHAWRRACRRCKGRGVEWRMRGLVLLMAKTRWSSTSPLASTVPLVVHTIEAPSLGQSR